MITKATHVVGFSISRWLQLARASPPPSSVCGSPARSWGSLIPPPFTSQASSSPSWRFFQLVSECALDVGAVGRIGRPRGGRSGTFYSAGRARAACDETAPM